ncbi:Hsp20/alpha crystallin family protein [Bdellovibrio sp. SKB1291214]|uniref:Hsp20/alpha crystallin family protein n=1 Tax=Bdellovibrio sp. SKB1291214 TaxID=1732569 RepID=UPI0020CD9074|nr:Hsp20/alpha crystallin family protein [Bdellovibrio sp. SKB1291214]UYL07525.1 Hsp20/alpha crystallin family protein [Bdellovibrio sp. SKB1291214]
MSMRSLSPWSARRPVGSDIFNQFEELFNQFDRGFTPAARETMDFSPSVDIEEKENAYIVTTDLPGFKKEDIKIEMADNVLTISGERIKEAGDKKYSERSYGKFQRTFSLPVHVAADKIEAAYKDGVLEVTLPKAENAKSRSIKVQ